jgi:predicted ATP-grasp superfamily ATP-dependent carboligase
MMPTLEANPGYPAVWKPRHGAGSQATFLLQGPADLVRVAEQAVAEGFTGPAILQRWVPGLPASIAWLVGPMQMLPLLPARQLLSDDGRFHYQGGELPLPAGLAGRAVRLSRQALEALPGLLGYVGIDLVLGDAADGSQDWLIELNPRLTTSYLGLRQQAKFNLAEAVLAVARGVAPPRLNWHEGKLRFSATAMA